MMLRLVLLVVVVVALWFFFDPDKKLETSPAPDAGVTVTKHRKHR